MAILSAISGQFQMFDLDKSGSINKEVNIKGILDFGFVLPSK